MASTKRAKPRTAKRAATPAKKQKATARTVKKTAAKPRAARARADKAVAAAPLLATAPKKVGKVTGKRADAVKPTAPHQPKTDVAPITSTVAKPTTQTKVKSSPAAAIPAFDPLALARPWMTLGAQMTMSNIALQARIARVAMDLPPAAAAMRQGSTVYGTWLAMFGRARPAKG